MIYIQHTASGIRAELEPFDGGVAYGEVGEPVAWVYERTGGWNARYYHEDRTPAYLTEGEGWTETPLYTGTPSANNELVKPGWDIDGMCDEHGAFCCPKCALLTRVKGDGNGN